MFRILETGPLTASRRSQAPMPDLGDRDADLPGPDAAAGLTLW
jgi:hypothetical protein